MSLNKEPDIEIPSSLTNFAAEKRKKICKHTLKDRIQDAIEEAYYPTPGITLAIVVGLVFLFFVVPYILAVWFPGFCAAVALFRLTKSDAIALHSGVGAIIFALIIFVAEGLRDSGNKDRGRVYLKESFLYPLIVAALAVFAILIVSGRTFANTVSVGFVLLLTLASIYRLLRVCLSNGLFQKRRSELLRRLVYRHVDRSVEQRLAINQFHSALNSEDFPLQHHWDYGISDEKFHRLSLAKSGYVEDIDLQKLGQIAELIDYYGAQEGKYYFASSDEDIKEDISRDELQSIPPELRPAEKDDHRYVHVKPGDDIEPDTVVLSVSKSVLKQESALSQIQNLLDGAISVAEREPLDFDLRLEFDATKKDLLRMLSAEESESFKDSFVAYLDLIEGFSARIEKCGGKYDYNQALKETGSFYQEGWEELNWIREDLRLFLDQGFDHFENEKIREVILAIPTRVSAIGLKNSDHLIFQQGMNLFSYSLGTFLDDKGKFGRAYDFYESFFKYNLRRKIHPSKLQNNSGNSDRGFYIYSIQSLVGLIKNLIKQEWWLEANKALQLFEDSFEDKDDQRDLFTTESIPDDLDSPESRVLQVRFGFAGWLTNKMLRANPVLPEYTALMDKFVRELPDDFSTLLKLFLQVAGENVRHFWGWDHWDIEPDGQVHTISPSAAVRAFGLPKLMELVGNADAMSADNISAFIASDRHPIEFEGSISEIAAQLENYKRIFPALSNEKIDLLKQFLGNVTAERNRLESEKLRLTSTSDEKKRQFIEKFHKSYLKHVTVRGLLNLYEKIDDRSGEETEDVDQRYGFNQLDEKAAFIENWRSSYSGWWENYSTGMAQGEDEFILQEFKKSASTIADIKIDEMENALAQLDITENSVIFFGIQLFTKLYKLPFFKPSHLIGETKWPRKHMSGAFELNGIYIPLYSVRKSLKQNELLIVDLEKAPTVVQLSPKISTDLIPMKQFQYFGYLLEAYSESPQLMEEILRKPPDWLLEKGTGDEMRRYLEEKVLVRIYENIRIAEMPKQNFASLIRLDVKNQNTEDDE